MNLGKKKKEWLNSTLSEDVYFPIIRAPRAKKLPPRSFPETILDKEHWITIPVEIRHPSLSEVVGSVLWRTPEEKLV